MTALHFIAVALAAVSVGHVLAWIAIARLWLRLSAAERDGIMRDRGLA